jgi:hypothetical protein
MFKSFVAWLDIYISREEPSTVLKALIGLMAFTGLLGTIFGSQAIRIGAFVVVILLIASAILLLLADRQRLRKEYNTHRKLLERYCDFVISNNSDPLVSIDSWTQTVFVHRNGDVKEILTIRAVALREEVYFIRFIEGSSWNQPERYRRRVHINARSLRLNGNSGPRWRVTRSWRSDQRINSIIHFDSPVLKGEEVRLEVERTWPAKCLPLMRDRVADVFYFRTSDLMRIERAEYRVVLPTGYDAVYEPVGFVETDSEFSMDATTDAEGRKVVAFKAARIPEHRKIGMRLELK